MNTVLPTGTYIILNEIFDLLKINIVELISKLIDLSFRKAC